jgi:hypothetical protein
VSGTGKTIHEEKWMYSTDSNWTSKVSTWPGGVVASDRFIHISSSQVFTVHLSH